MATKAIAGVGTLLQRADIGTADYFTIAEIRSISGPTMSKDTIDVSSFDSEGGYREYITGFKDAGELVMSMNFTNDSLTQTLLDYNTNRANHYRILFPNQERTTLAFDASVSGMPLDVPVDDAVTMEVTLRITGAVNQVPAPNILPTSLIVSPNMITIGAMGTTAQISIQVLPGTTTDKSVTFVSDDPAVATVPSTGTMQADGTTVVTITKVAAGTCTITATSTVVPTVDGTCAVTIA